MCAYIIACIVLEIINQNQMSKNQKSSLIVWNTVYSLLNIQAVDVFLCLVGSLYSLLNIQAVDVFLCSVGSLYSLLNIQAVDVFLCSVGSLYSLLNIQAVEVFLCSVGSVASFPGPVPRPRPAFRRLQYGKA